MATTTVIGNVVTAVKNNIATIKSAIGNATTSAAGLMTTAQVTKLNGIATGANKTTIVNNLTATTAGSALDAVQGKALSDSISSLNSSLMNSKWQIIVDQSISSQAITITLPLDTYTEMLFCFTDGANLSVGSYPTSILRLSAARITLSSFTYGAGLYGGWFNRSSVYQISDVHIFNNGADSVASSHVYIFGKT